MAYKINLDTIDTSQLQVFTEGRKRRIFVGKMTWDSQKNIFEFRYDPKYSKSKKAIPVGKELDLFKKSHISKGKLFPSFADRIPSKDNPAYVDYCKAQGIPFDETNPIILLVTIGRRGPSSFIFEPIKKQPIDIEKIKNFRNSLDISILDMSIAFDINHITLRRIELGKNADIGTLRRLEIYMCFPSVALWQIEMNMAKLHVDVFNKLWTYFENLKKLQNKKKQSSHSK